MVSPYRSPSSAAFFLLLIHCLIITISADCINGKENGERWDIGKCDKCSCVDNRISCLTLCEDNQGNPALYQQTRARTSISNSQHAYCLHEDRTHKHNESWHETSHHASSMDTSKECMQCHCHKKIVTCTIRSCKPVDCADPVREDGNCCLTCPKRKVQRKTTFKSEGCFQSGSVFHMETSWKMYIPVENQHGRCLQCSCKKNKRTNRYSHVCKQLKCPRLTCKEPLGKPGQCCGYCKDGTKGIDDSKNYDGDFLKSNFLTFGLLVENENDNDQSIPISNSRNLFKPGTVITTKKSKSNSKDCQFEEVYKNGETFIPKMSKCLRCKCQSSKIQCQRVICPSTFPCSNPIKREGLCCKVCPDISEDQARQIEATNVAPIENKRKSKGCGRPNDDRIQVYRYSTEEVSNALRSYFLFDRSNQIASHQSEMHSIELRSGKVDIAVSYIKDASQGISNKWKYLGSFKDKILKRIYKHEDDLKKMTDIANIIRKMDVLKKTIKEKAGRRRTCKSTTVLPLHDVSSILKTLQEVDKQGKRKR